VLRERPMLCIRCVAPSGGARQLEEPITEHGPLVARVISSPWREEAVAEGERFLSIRSSDEYARLLGELRGKLDKASVPL
jgi:hypothetical protein